MNKTLIILPARLQSDRGFQEKEMPSLQCLGKEAPQVFYFTDDNVAELKKTLVEGDFASVVVGFASLEAECPDLRMVKSLALRGRLVLYRPEMKYFTETAPTSPRNADLQQWREAGRALVSSMLKLADAIAVPGEEKPQLRQAVPGATVLAVEELRDYAAAVSADRGRKTVSIVMLTFNQRAVTQQCIESLVRHTQHPYELIVVDNGSADGTREYLEQLAKERSGIKLIFNEKNVGFSKANNQGMKIAEGDYLLLLNNDVILTDGWLERMLLCLDSDAKIGVVGPVTNKAVAQQVVGTQVAFNDADIQRFACMQLLDGAGHWFATHRIIGFCMLLKKEVILKVGMLDERFGPGGFEDYDFCLRITQAGYKIMVAGDVFVYHIGGQGYHKNNLDYTKLREQNVQIFIEKWCRKALEAMEIMPDGI